jgi:hypothetical protein
MDDEDRTLESGQDEQSTEMPSPRFASGGDERPSTDVDAIAAALQVKLGTWLDGELDKRLQSQKDRRFSKLEKQFDDVDARLTRFAELVQGGMKPDQARQQLDVEDAVDYVRQLRQGKRAGAPVDQPALGSAEQEQAMTEANEILKEAGLDSDPAWVETLRKTTFKDGAHLLKTAATFVIKRTTAKPPENPATTISPGGGTLPRPDLEAAYQKEINAARGKGAAAGRVIREKYRALGLNV